MFLPTHILIMPDKKSKSTTAKRSTWSHLQTTEFVIEAENHRGHTLLGWGVTKVMMFLLTVSLDWIPPSQSLNNNWRGC